MIKFFRKYHKWPSLIFTLFILIFAISGIILNHRKTFSPLDVSRNVLPENYRYKNWNLASLKSAVRVDPDRVLLFGNIGVWQTDSTFRKFLDLNKGFPKGIDKRKVTTLGSDTLTGLWAGTLFGLYRFDSLSTSWSKVPLPVDEERIVKVFRKGDSLMVMTRSNLLYSTASTGFRNFSVIPLPPAADDDGKTGLFRTLWVIHSGEIYGIIGKLIVDFIGISFIVICITGLIYFFVPYVLKNMKENAKARIKKFNRSSLKWHNVLGSWLVVFLILTTLTGMFLRPPLLIPIAGSRVDKIRYTELDSPNTWFDRLRDVVYDDSLNRWIVATSEGIYYSDDDFIEPLVPYPAQPPVSVMGINVLEIIAPGKYLIGSFSGIFLWIPGENRVIDYVTKTPHVDKGGGGPPFGAVSVAGFMKTGKGSEVIFDYAGGVITLSGTNPLPGMPENVLHESPISLWNTALEFHTGRIFEPLLGDFYILVVPIVGLATLFIIVTGFFSWYLAKRRKSRPVPQLSPSPGSV